MVEKNINVSLYCDSLTIRGEKQEETEADFKKSTLRIRLPKIPEVQTIHKKIKIKTGRRRAKFISEISNVSSELKHNINLMDARREFGRFSIEFDPL